METVIVATVAALVVAGFAVVLWRKRRAALAEKASQAEAQRRASQPDTLRQMWAALGLDGTEGNADAISAFFAPLKDKPSAAPPPPSRPASPPRPQPDGDGKGKPEGAIDFGFRYDPNAGLTAETKTDHGSEGKKPGTGRGEEKLEPLHP